MTEDSQRLLDVAVSSSRELAELALETFGLIPSHIDTEPARAGLEARLGALEAGAVS